MAPGSSSSCWECENPLLSYLHPFFWPLDHLVTKKFCWDEASNAIIQTCLHSNGLTWAGTAVKMVPNLEQGKSKLIIQHGNKIAPTVQTQNKSKSCISKVVQAEETCGRAGDRRLQQVLPSNTIFLLQFCSAYGTLQSGRSERF